MGTPPEGPTTSGGVHACARRLILADGTDIVNGMARPTDGPQAKSEKYSARFTPAEVKASRAIRGSMSMGTWMRTLVVSQLIDHRLNTGRVVTLPGKSGDEE